MSLSIGMSGAMHIEQDRLQPGRRRLATIKLAVVKLAFSWLKPVLLK